MSRARAQAPEALPVILAIASALLSGGALWAALGSASPLGPLVQVLWAVGSHFSTWASLEGALRSPLSGAVKERGGLRGEQGAQRLPLHRVALPGPGCDPRPPSSSQ